MNENANLISAGWQIVSCHKRYIFWFWVLNLTLAEFGAAAYRGHVHSALDHSLLADRLLHGADIAVYLDMVTRPEWGTTAASVTPALFFAFLFFVATLGFLPGVLEAYTSEGRPSREEFFRVCGRNLWRFVRVLLLFAVVALPVAGVLSAGQHGLWRAAEKSSNEKMPFYVACACAVVIYLVMTAIRIWFDVVQVDIVISDRNAVRKSAAAGFRHVKRQLFRLMACYIVVGLAGVAVLAAGVWFWHAFIPPGGVLGAFLVGQIILVFCLGARFWQRAVAAAFYQREMDVTVPVVPSLAPILTPTPASPETPLAPLAPEGS